MKHSIFYFLFSKLYFVFLFSIFYFLISVATANAATLFFSPSAGSYNVGQTFSVNVYVSSAEQAMNAASGIVSFPNDKLTVTSISKAGSMFSLWVQEPSFSNDNGTVSFEGIVFNPGFTGARGRIVTINFRTRSAGRALLSFSNGSILANDGMGTNIITGMENANFMIRVAEVIDREDPEIRIPTEVVGLPFAPIINSTTHPDPNKWYTNRNVKFTWNLPQNITGVRLLVSRDANAIPAIIHIPPINQRELFDLENGVWYFAARFRNEIGWGAISRFRFQIDTEKPESFEIREISREDLTNPRVRFNFIARDRISGISHYEIEINRGETQIWRDDGSGIYETPVLSFGRHSLVARAVDRAGNLLTSFIEFEILPLNAPIITDFPKQLLANESFVIQGTTKYPNAQTILWFSRDNEEAEKKNIQNDSKGNFMFIIEDGLQSGIYRIWTEVIDARGAKSTTSEEIKINIRKPAFIIIGNKIINLFTVLIPLVALIFTLAFIIYYSWHKFILFKNKIKKETDEAQQTLRQAFKILRRKVEEQVAKFDGNNNLNDREKIICEELKKTLKISEKIINKEIQDIENIENETNNKKTELP